MLGVRAALLTARTVTVALLGEVALSSVGARTRACVFCVFTVPGETASSPAAPQAKITSMIKAKHLKAALP